jgi:hypothetical protein
MGQPEHGQGDQDENRGQYGRLSPGRLAGRESADGLAELADNRRLGAKRGVLLAQERVRAPEDLLAEQPVGISRKSARMSRTYSAAKRAMAVSKP